MSPFAKATLGPMAQAAGMKTPTPSRLQHALRVLADRAILVKTARGVYAFDAPAFERWLRDARPAAGRRPR